MTDRQESTAVLQFTCEVTADDVRAMTDFVLGRVLPEIDANDRRRPPGEPVAGALDAVIVAVRTQALRSLAVLQQADADPLQRTAALVQLDSAWTALTAAAEHWKAEPGFDTARWRRPAATRLFPDRLGPIAWVPAGS
ncbi:hypothetical protein [Kitasatospora sp. NPDC004272]